MESKNTTNRNSNSRTRRNNTRAQAYRDSRIPSRSSNSVSKTTISSQNNNESLTEQLKTRELENISSAKLNPEEKQKAKEQQELIKKREQEFKEAQKRRIEELFEEQKYKEEKKRRSDRYLSPEAQKEEQPKKEPKSEIKTESPKKDNNLSLDDFVPNNSQKDPKNSHNIINDIDKINRDFQLENKEESINTISKQEEKELLDKLNKIKELELTSRIKKLTKEALDALEKQAQAAENKSVDEVLEEVHPHDVKEALDSISKKASSNLPQDHSTPEPKEKKKKKKSKKGGFLLVILLIISIGLFGYSIVNIIEWQMDNNDIKDLTNEINDMADVVETPGSSNVEIIDQQEEVPKSDPYWDYIKVPLINVDFNELNKTNSETVGWIQVMGTNINYPFVQTKDNKYYLTHSFDKEKNSAGWVFMDYRNNVQEFDRNNIIYAHGRLDTTMFGSLKNILTSGWLKNKDNYIVRLSTEYENTLWQVFSVYRIKTTGDYIKVNFANDKEFGNFTKMIQERSAHNFNTTVQPTDKILTLSTCYNQTDKVVLHAKLIKREART